MVDNLTKNEWKPEWGLSIYIEYEGRKILLDTGATGTFAKNAEAMGIHIRDVEFGVLSHAHYDHANGLETFFEMNPTAKFYIRAGARENCYKTTDTSEKKYIGIREGTLEKYADRIVYVEGDFEIVPGVTLIPHKTPGLEKLGKAAGMYLWTPDGWKVDSFVHEQSLVIDAAGGLVIFNSCSHGGADNIIREVEATYPGRKIKALVGGLHLFQSSDEEVRAVADRIRGTGIENLYTGHCTGDRAMEILKEELGDGAVQLYTGLEMVF